MMIRTLDTVGKHTRGAGLGRHVPGRAREPNGSYSDLLSKAFGAVSDGLSQVHQIEIYQVQVDSS
jgi:hypothetical protein